MKIARFEPSLSRTPRSVLGYATVYSPLRSPFHFHHDKPDSLPRTTTYCLTLLGNTVQSGYVRKSKVSVETPLLDSSLLANSID
jgi:hypothetical protein